MFKKDLSLTSSHDLKIDNFDLVLTDDNVAIAQRVKQALLLFKGEWFLNRDLGVPYYTDILGSKNSIDSVRSIFVKAIHEVEGVKDLVDLSIQFSDTDRVLKINLTVMDDLNNQLNVEL